MKIEDGDSGWTSLGKFTGALVTGAVLSVWQGYAITVLWRWFVVPPFSAPAPVSRLRSRARNAGKAVPANACQK